eukprot:2362134-Pyramimonas_sp.AAC.1
MQGANSSPATRAVPLFHNARFRPAFGRRGPRRSVRLDESRREIWAPGLRQWFLTGLRFFPCRRIS